MIKIKETIRFHHGIKGTLQHYIFSLESFLLIASGTQPGTTKFTLKENTHIAFPRTIQLL